MGCKSSLDKTKQKPKHRKGLWSPEEDQRLRNYILQHGHGCWSSVATNAGLQRNGKSCRLRWINYLRPGLKRGTFSLQEEEAILNLHRALGNKWSQIAQHLPGRTDNEIKNFWHSYLKKKVAKAEEIESISKTNLTNLTSQEANESPGKSNTTASSFDSFGKGEAGSSMDSHPSVSNIQSCLPKLFFAEWLTLDNMNNTNNNNEQTNNIQANQFSCNYNYSKDTCTLDVQEDFAHQRGSIYSNNEGSCSTDELYNGIGNGGVFDSQLKFEEQTLENVFGDLFSGDEISDDMFMTNNLMYI